MLNCCGGNRQNQGKFNEAIHQWISGVSISLNHLHSKIARSLHLENSSPLLTSTTNVESLSLKVTHSYSEKSGAYIFASSISLSPSKFAKELFGSRQAMHHNN
jgi:hypothetical protein